MKIKYFSQRSWNDEDKPLIKQIEAWLRNKEFSHFETHHSSLQTNEEFDYIYSLTIFYEEK